MEFVICPVGKLDVKGLRNVLFYLPENEFFEVMLALGKDDELGIYEEVLKIIGDYRIISANSSGYVLVLQEDGSEDKFLKENFDTRTLHQVGIH